MSMAATGPSPTVRLASSVGAADAAKCALILTYNPPGGPKTPLERIETTCEKSIFPISDRFCRFSRIFPYIAYTGSPTPVDAKNRPKMTKFGQKVLQRHLWDPYAPPAIISKATPLARADRLRGRAAYAAKTAIFVHFHPFSPIFAYG